MIRRATKSAAAPAATASSKANTLRIQGEPGKPHEQRVTELATRGILPMSSVLKTYSRDTYSDEISVTDAYRELERLSSAAATGDLAHLERLLAAQALALNSVFAGLAHRSKSNSQAGYLDAADTYMRLALRAQAQCRQTAQTLFEMKNPRPVAFVQQANINHGGQQQVNNGAAPGSWPEPSRAEEVPIAPSELLGAPQDAVSISSSATQELDATPADPLPARATR
ncbi:MAG TPA: hypothetical protein VIY30_10675 [Burkholderiaceae bacterium]